MQKAVQDWASDCLSPITGTCRNSKFCIDKIKKESNAFTFTDTAAELILGIEVQCTAQMDSESDILESIRLIRGAAVPVWKNYGCKS